MSWNNCQSNSKLEYLLFPQKDKRTMTLRGFKPWLKITHPNLNNFVFSLDCFEQYDYNGNNVEGAKIVSSEFECQKRCLYHSKCKFWTFVISTKYCWLKTSKSGRTENEDTISGAKFCNSKCVHEYVVCQYLQERIICNTFRYYENICRYWPKYWHVLIC